MTITKAARTPLELVFGLDRGRLDASLALELVARAYIWLELTSGTVYLVSNKNLGGSIIPKFYQEFIKTHFKALWRL